MNDCDPTEIAAYEVVRQRLRRLAQRHPWILDVTLALQERYCPTCSKRKVIENPPDQCRCLHCGATWTLPDVRWPVRSRTYRRVV